MKTFTSEGDDAPGEGDQDASDEDDRGIEMGVIGEING
jgi:hypothetical protein